MDNKILKLGFWSGLIAFVSTIAFLIAQSFQLIGILHYPWDEILIYGFSLCITVPFVLEMLALHHTTTEEKKYWSHAALIFSVIYLVFVTANYVVQLATVIPMTMKGSADEIKLLIQTPHSLFWNFDAIGYIFMGLSTLFAVPVFEKKGLQKWTRFIFLIHGIVNALIAFVYFYPDFTEELLLLAIPWGITAPASMLLLAMLFKKGFDKENQKTTGTSN